MLVALQGALRCRGLIRPSEAVLLGAPRSLTWNRGPTGGLTHFPAEGMLCPGAVGGGGQGECPSATPGTLHSQKPCGNKVRVSGRALLLGENKQAAHVDCGPLLRAARGHSDACCAICSLRRVREGRFWRCIPSQASGTVH